MFATSAVLNTEPIALPRTTILVLSSEKGLVDGLEKTFTQYNYGTLRVHDIPGALASARSEKPSLVILTREHLAFVDSMRRDPTLYEIPTVVLHPHQSNDQDAYIADLERGVDFCTGKCEPRLVAVYVRAILRRERQRLTASNVYTVGRLKVDVDRHEVMINDQAVPLTPKEFQIVYQLALAPSRVFSRNELLDLVWGQESELCEHTLDVHIYSIRQKIETDSTRPTILMTVRGVGYKLKAD